MVWWRKLNEDDAAGDEQTPYSDQSSQNSDGWQADSLGHEITVDNPPSSYWQRDDNPHTAHADPADLPEQVAAQPSYLDQYRAGQLDADSSPADHTVDDAHSGWEDAPAEADQQSASYSYGVRQEPTAAGQPSGGLPSSGTDETHHDPKGNSVTDYNASLDEAMKIDGALGVALVDSQSGMSLASAGSPPGLDLDVAAAGNSNVVRAKLATMRDLGIQEAIEDILITLGTQYHIIRPTSRQQGLFIYLVLDKDKANLAMARFKLSAIESKLEI